jgi:DNA-binding transcriptional regulator YiaG
MEKVNRKIDCELGNFIWNVVNKSGLSQERWAELLEVTPRTMSYYCSGQRKPTHKRLLRFIKVAGINVEDIPF